MSADIDELITGQAREISRPQARALGTIRPNLGSSLAIGAFIGGTVAAIAVGSAWFLVADRNMPLSYAVAEVSVLLAFAAFLGWLVAFGFLNYGIVLRDEAVYVLHWQVRSRNLYVEKVAWEQLGHPELSPQGSQLSFFPVGSLSPVLMSKKEATALVTDTRWASRFNLPADVAERIGLQVVGPE